LSVSLHPPETVDGRLVSSNVSTLVVIHIIALLAFIPWFFSWTGVALVFVGNYVFGSLGINIGFHRLLTHRSFQCPRWLEQTFTLLGICALQDAPVHWVAAHRIHHQHSDKQPDPHSPLVNFSWGHIGWLIRKNRRLRDRATLEKYARDLLQDPFHAALHRHRLWLWVYVAHVVLFFAVGCLAGWLISGTAAKALQFGLSVLVWGVFVRTVYVWHVTWAVNSVTHRWGYRNYETGENSRNNWIVALLSHGEGWHNNHHADQRSARHGHRWWEVDLIYWTILLLHWVGLATDIRPPSVAAARLKAVPARPVAAQLASTHASEAA
jgi:fatty-acid desaturase